RDPAAALSGGGDDGRKPVAGLLGERVGQKRQHALQVLGEEPARPAGEAAEQPYGKEGEPQAARVGKEQVAKEFKDETLSEGAPVHLGDLVPGRFEKLG